MPRKVNVVQDVPRSVSVLEMPVWVCHLLSPNPPSLDISPLSVGTLEYSWGKKRMPILLHSPLLPLGVGGGQQDVQGRSSPVSSRGATWETSQWVLPLLWWAVSQRIPLWALSWWCPSGWHPTAGLTVWRAGFLLHLRELLCDAVGTSYSISMKSEPQHWVKGGPSSKYVPSLGILTQF